MGAHYGAVSVLWFRVCGAKLSALLYRRCDAKAFCDSLSRELAPERLAVGVCNPRNLAAGAGIPSALLDLARHSFPVAALSPAFSFCIARRESMGFINSAHNRADYMHVSSEILQATPGCRDFCSPPLPADESQQTPG
jgi:hypothetical protein